MEPSRRLLAQRMVRPMAYAAMLIVISLGVGMLGYHACAGLSWIDAFVNTVVTVGKNHILDTEFAGSAYTAAWDMGLVDGGSAPTIVAGDTMASHAGWTENTGYSNANRPSRV